MSLTAPAIIGIVGLLLMSIPGIRYILRIIRRAIHFRRKQHSSSNTVLPVFDEPSPSLDLPGGARLSAQATSTIPIDMHSMNSQMVNRELSNNSIIIGLQLFVSVSTSTPVFWKAVDPQPHSSGRSIRTPQVLAAGASFSPRFHQSTVFKKTESSNNGTSCSSCSEQCPI
ncbi:hypothetical protein F5Y12DRAFT_791874 [Xylaria sp. FL1777]|nr:hypothetical protein F5Y12DRAFT_791874 [Xylaria sp. FL1777]